MPTIDISPMQARALARGEDITISAPPTRRFIVVSEQGNVWDVLTPDPPTFRGRGAVSIRGECRLIAKGPHSRPIGSVQSCINTIADIIEVGKHGRDA